MRSLEKILVATDFQRASKDALQMAFALAKEFHSEIILIHVVPEIEGYSVSRGKIRKKVMEKLKQMEIDSRKKGVPSVETIVRFGIPFERVIEHSEELDSNLIIIGSGEKEKQYPYRQRGAWIDYHGWGDHHRSLHLSDSLFPSPL